MLGIAHSPLRGSRRVRLLSLGLLLVLILVWRPSPPFPRPFPEEPAEQAVRHEGKSVRFDRTRGSYSGQISRILLYQHLAQASGRAYAYDPIQIDDSIFRWPWRSARIPLSAVSSLEGAVPVSALSCSAADTYVSTSRGLEDIQTALKRDEKCIRISGDVFDDEFFHSLSTSLMEDILKTSIYRPSPRVLDILNTALPRLSPDSPRAMSKATQLRHLLVLELLGGDKWEKVCEDAAEHTLPFFGFNTLPKHPGNENIPPPSSLAKPAKEGLYNAKCQPSVLEIIARARRMRKNHPLLKSAYLVLDAPSKWRDEVRKWLLSEGWEQVWIGSRDFWNGEEVGEAVEMEVARRAGVYVGNGFSPFSSNVVLVRRQDGIHPDLTQYW